ncbi:MAG: arginyltransferase [Hyphomicrobiales bacterium]|nr:arginyltransferase [Hyphomicrobiales bacterium]
MKHSRDLPQFYLTAPALCPYLDGKLERKVFTHLVGQRAGMLNDALTQCGFRRSQNIAYRPACEKCDACVSVRVLVDEFRLNRSFRRTRRRNADIVSSLRSAEPTSEQYALFRDYLDIRHAEGGMADMSVLDYTMMVEDSSVETRIVEYRAGEGAGRGSGAKSAGPLVAVSLVDILADGLSMVYSFYDPGAADRSLGTYMILDHIERARKFALPYLYLGYWVEGSPKMAYKARFQPQEHLRSAGWVRFIEKSD